MPINLKSIQEYFSKIKIPNSRFPSILSGCRHPRTPSFAVHRADHHHKKDDAAATLYDIDQFLLENFKSLYVENGDENHQQQKSNKLKIGDEKRRPDPPTVYGSRRFFVAIGSSSSLMEEARLSVTRCSEEGGGRSRSTSTTSNATTICDGDNIDGEDDSYIGDRNGEYGDKDAEDNIYSNEDEIQDVVDDYITVKTYSWNPYFDFRRSMTEMIEAKLEEDGKVDWEFMEELLVSYLNLNEKKSRKFIISAFVDLTTSFFGHKDRVRIRQEMQ